MQASLGTHALVVKSTNVLLYNIKPSIICMKIIVPQHSDHTKSICNIKTTGWSCCDDESEENINMHNRIDVVSYPKCLQIYHHLVLALPISSAPFGS